MDVIYVWMDGCMRHPPPPHHHHQQQRDEDAACLPAMPPSIAHYTTTTPHLHGGVHGGVDLARGRRASAWLDAAHQLHQRRPQPDRLSVGGMDVRVSVSVSVSVDDPVVRKRPATTLRARRSMVLLVLLT